MRRRITVCILFACSTLWGQSPGGATHVPGQSQGPQAATPVANDPRSAFTEAHPLAEILQQIQASSSKSNADVARLRIDKWKIDATGRQQAQATAESIRRNLSNAVPDLIQQLQSSPASLIANFRLYRNLNALYDTFSSLVESAGAFGAREQYDSLADDISQLDHLRHQMAERIDLLAGTDDAELARLRAKVATLATAPKPVTKIVVNDDPPKSRKKPKASPPPAQSPVN
jgi:hypothetical protein